MLTCVEKRIRAFKGRSNLGLRNKIRNAAKQGPDAVLMLRRRIALTYDGEAKLQAVADALRYGCG